MPSKPADFDCRNTGQVLRLRMRDWMWPVAVIFAVTIPIMGSRTSGPYAIGSPTFYLNVWGPKVMLAAVFFAGVRWCSLGWCWIGAAPRSDPSRCAHCDYHLGGLCAERGPLRCPECGIDTATPPSWRRPSIARTLIDLPGLLLALLPVFLIALLMLVLLRLIDVDL